MERMRRLPGRAVRHFGFGVQRHQLWLADKFLLYREILGWREDVRRFYYEDIQGVVCTPTGHGRACTGVTFAILVVALPAAIWATWVGNPVAFVLSWIVSVVVLVILLGNLFLGRTCRTTLYTATAEAPLYSLGRMRSADRAIARLSERIAQAQAHLPTVEAPEDAEGTAGEPAETPTDQVSDLLPSDP